ncbi:hypothetical protein BDV96DRAFT_601633 [Lophiotrema nucula]|uniref:BZIP domain-containing protein n=1 Tax=Lophiotrema nucula TaxID=690887 RepID=A0A6A5Z338_9PLEO|nr:hypothetical protein BDV96DRAFT_601633 [Lophiotrema nucula]
MYDPSSTNTVGRDYLINAGSSPTSPQNQSPSSSDRSSSPTKLSNTKTSSLPVDSARIEKRRQNTLAARRYRQKRVDQMSGLESQLKETQGERDDLRVKVARLEGEVETLRQLLRSQK